jgi:hypothetical protein
MHPFASLRNCFLTFVRAFTFAEAAMLSAEFFINLFGYGALALVFVALPAYAFLKSRCVFSARGTSRTVIRQPNGPSQFPSDAGNDDVRIFQLPRREILRSAVPPEPKQRPDPTRLKQNL